MEPRWSPGAGGALGVRARTEQCAVVGCKREAHPQICLYDGSYHRHGGIHYWCDAAKPSSLEFKEEGWYWMCNMHYETLKRELEERRKKAA